MSIKDIWNNIINYDLTSLFPDANWEGVGFGICLLISMGLNLYLYNKYLKSGVEKIENWVEDNTVVWYFRPLRWVYYLYWFAIVFIAWFVGAGLLEGLLTGDL